MVWAIGLGCVLPEDFRLLGLMMALVIVQWPRLDAAVAVPPLQRQHLPRAWGGLLMVLALAIGELNILAYQTNLTKRPTLLGDLAFSKSIPDVHMSIIVLLGLSLAFAVTSRLIQRIFPPVSDSA
jgi:hypothetical protein